MAKHAWWVALAIVAVLGCSKAKEGGAAAGSASGSAAPAGSAAAPAGSATAPAGNATAPAGSAAIAPSGSAAAPGATAGSGSAVADGFKVGDTVYGQWTDGDWYPGKIGKINDDGTYRVNYNDGDVSPKLTAKQVKPRKTGGGGGGAAASKSGGGEPCPGTGWTRCGGNCYLLTDDRYNCGACGHSCPSNMSVCRNGVCDCTGVEKDSNGGVCPP